MTNISPSRSHVPDRIVVIGYNLSGSRKLAQQLTSFEYTDVLAAHSPEHALELCKKRKPAAVVVESCLRCMSGFQLIEQIIEASPTHYPRIVLLIADAGDIASIFTDSLRGRCTLLRWPFTGFQLTKTVWNLTRGYYTATANLEVRNRSPDVPNVQEFDIHGFIADFLEGWNILSKPPIAPRTARIEATRSRLSRLLRMYGCLLTPSQFGPTSDFCFHGKTFTQLGRAYGVTRQSIHELIKAVMRRLETIERKLGLVETQEGEYQNIDAMRLACDQLRTLRNGLFSHKVFEPTQVSASIDDVIRILQSINGRPGTRNTP